MYNTIKDIMVGLVSGCLSSAIVTILWQRKLDAKEQKYQLEARSREYKTSYYETIQNLCRYLDRLQLELELTDLGEKSQNVRRLLDSHPSTGCFTEAMNKDGVNELARLYKLEIDLDKEARDNTLTDEASKRYKMMLFEIECHLLKHQADYLKPYKQEENAQRTI